MTIITNITARDTLTHLWAGQPAPVALTAAEAQGALFGHHYKGPGKPKIEDVRRAVDEISREFGDAEVRALLHRFGVQKASELWIGSYRDLIEFVEDCFAYDTPPSASWTDGKPTLQAL